MGGYRQVQGKKKGVQVLPKRRERIKTEPDINKMYMDGIDEKKIAYTKLYLVLVYMAKTHVKDR